MKSLDKHPERGNVKQSKERWEKEHLDPALARISRAPMPSDLEQQRLYTPLDDSARDYLDELGFPGEYPYTRGVQPSMYQGRSSGARSRQVRALVVIQVSK